MARFLVKAELACGTEVGLSQEESHHLAKVLRMEVGSECELVDGAGTVAKARIVENHPKRARCLILSVSNEKNFNKIHIAFAIPKSNALDFIIHRCTEVGVASFQPLTTDHSLKINSWNESRWERVVIETAKQCQEIHFPVVLPPLNLESWLFQKRDKSRELIYCDEEARHNALDAISIEKEVDLLIGSEGGWSEKERNEFQKLGKAMGLGKNRLRAETACIVALSLLKKHWNEL